MWLAYTKKYVANIQTSISLEGVKAETLKGIPKVVVATMNNDILDEPFLDNSIAFFQVSASFWLLADAGNN